MPISVRPVQPGDSTDWERMRHALWPAESTAHAREIAAFFQGERRHLEEALIAMDDSRAVGFAELSIRGYAEGCHTDRVAYLEGWYVEELARGRGVGAALVRAAEAWGRVQGCEELASDTELHNDASVAAHRALGFEEVERIVCFRKAL